ncbi:B82 [miniopterid betaherpesvirus 1]|uniref:B82 n=1 Tax=miniopterid betaherpesvirus 1 TaxID=3070189 RepID=I3VQ76_9BETA|nr:B82 [miniopterid betaherpesvirus 1]AFK83920.1 B82 [miniopterid betaherpesvirus 1]
MAQSTVGAGRPPAASAVASVIQLAFRRNVNFGPRETKVLRTGLNILGIESPIMLCVTGNDEDYVAPDKVRVRFTSMFVRSGDVLNVSAKITNVSFTPAPAKDEPPLIINVFALPLLSVSVNPLHMFRPAPSSESARPPRSSDAGAGSVERHSVVIKQASYVWTVRTLLRKLQWVYRTDPNLEEGGYSIATAAINTDPIPLDQVDGVQVLTCSDKNVHVHKVETANHQNGGSGPIKMYVRHIGPQDPSSELFLHFMVYANHSPIVMRHNTVPFFEPVVPNGFVVKCPKKIQLVPGQHVSVFFENGYSSLNEYVALFFPADIPGVDISGGVWHERQNCVVEMEAETDRTIDRDETLGRIHFFPEEIIERTRLGVGMVAAMQSETRTFVTRPDDSDDESSESSESSPSSDSETPRILRDADAHDRFQWPDSALRFPQRLQRPNPAPLMGDDDIEIRWKPWNVTTRASFFTPLSYTLDHNAPNAESARALEWKETVYHDGLSATWVDASGSKINPKGTRRDKPLRL